MDATGHCGIYKPEGFCPTTNIDTVFPLPVLINYRPALVLHSVLGDSDYTNACICFPCHNKTLTAKLGLGGALLHGENYVFPDPLSSCAFIPAAKLSGNSAHGFKSGSAFCRRKSVLLSKMRYISDTSNRISLT